MAYGMKFRLILIGTAGALTGKNTLLAELFREGLECFHLRGNHLNESVFRHILESIPQEFHPRIVIHDHYSLALDFAIKGIHLTELTRKQPLPPNLNDRLTNLSLSASFHSLSELKSNTIPYDYVFLSPVFDSISKPGYKSSFSAQMLRESLTEKRNESSGLLSPIFALGGINAENVVLVKEMGFDGAAVMGGIWDASSPQLAFSRLNLLAE
jgi:thiamine-phosphate pyrophosphorylase